MKRPIVIGGFCACMAVFAACASQTSEQSARTADHPTYVPQGILRTGAPVADTPKVAVKDEADEPVESVTEEEDRFEENGPGVHGLVYEYPSGWSAYEGRWYGGLATVELRQSSSRIVAVLYPTVNQSQVDRVCARFREAFEAENEPVPERLLPGEAPQVVRSNNRKAWFVCRRALPRYPSYTLAVMGAGPRSSLFEQSVEKFYGSLRVEDE